MASVSAHVGKSLELKSPMGERSAFYKWPLQKGKGSVRRAENKEDEAAEILETIRYYFSNNFGLFCYVKKHACVSSSYLMHMENWHIFIRVKFSPKGLNIFPLFLTTCELVFS